MTDATPAAPPPPSNPASIDKLLGVAGGLWAFFGLALAGLLKEAILAPGCGRLVPAAGPVMTVIIGFFIANWVAIFVVQYIGVTYGMDGQAPAVKRWARGGHWACLALHAVISVSAALALNASIATCRSAPPPEPAACAPVQVCPASP